MALRLEGYTVAEIAPGRDGWNGPSKLKLRAIRGLLGPHLRLGPRSMSTTDTRQLDGEALLRIARAVERLDVSWPRGDPIRLEEFLRGGPGDERRAPLRHGLYVELKHRRGRGEWPDAGEYAQRFPNDAATVRAVFAEPEASLLAAGSVPSETTPAPRPPSLRRMGGRPTCRRQSAAIGSSASWTPGARRSSTVPRTRIWRWTCALRSLAPAHGPGPGPACRRGADSGGAVHPNLVRVLDLDVFEGRPFLVMEFVRGRNLKQVVEEEGRPTPRAAVAWVAAAARAAARAPAGHRASGHQAAEHPARRVGQPAADRLRHRPAPRRLVRGPQPDHRRHAPLHAAGAVREEANRIGPRSDVFGLGAVLYFLLTGRPPFEGKDRRAVLARAGRCEFDRTALRSTGVSRGLEHICLRARRPNRPTVLPRRMTWPEVSIVLCASLVGMFLRPRPLRLC